MNVILALYGDVRDVVPTEALNSFNAALAGRSWLLSNAAMHLDFLENYLERFCIL